jgi:Fe-S oxidoreductase
MKEEEIVEGSLIEGLNEALISCEKCRLCNTVCPVLDIRITQGSFGMNRAIYYALKWNVFSEELRDLVYSCTTCGKCVAMCKNVSRAIPLVEIFEKVREFLLVEKMLGPMPDQISVLKNMHVRGNPWGYPSHERTKWSQELKLKFASKENRVEVLYYVGCASSYDPQCQKIARNLSKILKQARVNFGILEREICSGHEARRLGETGLFQYLSENITEMLEETEIKHVITGDPHDFYSFTHEYAGKRDDLIVQHYVQFLNEILDKERLKLRKEVHKKVTYHDPCYLGRHSQVFDEPRKLIQRIPGIELVEMENTRADSDCCGMGGGRMWTETPKGLVSSQTIAERRIQQALDTGADILLTACPFCNISLNDAVKSLNKEDHLKVIDITELIVSSI